MSETFSAHPLLFCRRLHMVYCCYIYMYLTELEISLLSCTIYMALRQADFAHLNLLNSAVIHYNMFVCPEVVIHPLPLNRVQFPSKLFSRFHNRFSFPFCS